MGIQAAFLRLVPCKRGLGIRLGSGTQSLDITPNLDANESAYPRAMQVQTPQGQLSLRAAFGEEDLEGTDSDDHDVAIWQDDGVVSAVAVYRADLGTLEIPGRPEFVGIRVGTPIAEVLTALRVGPEDITVLGSNMAGPFVELTHLPGARFELDGSNGGTNEWEG